MKLFIDTANLEAIRKYSFILEGVTTNPSLMAKEGHNYEQAVKEIVKLVDGPISAEVVSENWADMVDEAEQFVKIHKNVVIKVPMTEQGLKAVKALKKKGIKTNVTLVFSTNQALLAAKAGADFVSPFVGRLDDLGQDGMQLVGEIKQVYSNYNFKTQIIVASIRHPLHVAEAAKIGADVCTVPPNVLEKMFKHALTDKGIKAFLEDYQKLKQD
jgi:transaldolase